MRRLALTKEAECRLEAQIDYLLERGASKAATALLDRVYAFLEGTVSQYPASGRLRSEREVWEMWIPGTRVIAWYRFDDETVTVITFWHAAQDRDAVD